MKKQFALLLAVCMAFFMTACFNTDGYGNDKLYFEARIIAVEGIEMLVGGGDVGLCIVTFPDAFDLSEYQRGDYVEIGHSGSVADSYPSQARGYAIRSLSREEIKNFRQEVSLTGICEELTEDTIRVRSGDSLYVIRKANAEELPSLVVGDTVVVVYDGILDFGAGTSEICFPISIEVTK